MIYTKKQAYAEIVKLVNTFKTSEIRLNNEGEAQIENNFIRPLFKYLNWNTENDGLAIPDYEFVVQRTNRYGKRPDYVLQLDGQHLLVIDAKQVKLDMHDPRWMNQVYAYAYSTQSLAPSRKIDFAILTDFQEFVVLDCTLYAGNPKAVAKFKVLDWRYNDYVTQFDTLWELFERANMRQAACTRGTDAPEGLWARALSPKKVKANRIPPDKAFLMEMDDDKTGWRVRLAKDMKKHNPAADGALITAAVQLLIDRLIFVKALSDREIEDDYLSQLAETVERDGLAESDTGWLTACRAIFTKLNEFYNGSIFEPRPELEAVTVSNKVVRAIIHDLQPENSSYNFAVLPVEILGTIYERFLGRVVRTTDKQVKIEDKPEVRKAGGVYYTPQYIVNYIVQNTVGKLLEQCRTPEDVAKLKILDPACGSGSFLLGAYNALIGWHISYYSDKARLTKRDRAAVYYDSDGRVRLTAKLKRQILLNNLYGVDIDRQAVEVTRFSLSLKALEDIRQGEVYEERSLFKQTVLPDLSQNIKCGNSLIGPDYFADQMFSDTDELKLVNPFDWKQQFPHGSFDAVIGNPPYVLGRETFNLSWKKYIASHYQSYQGKYDLYIYFTERAVNLLRPKGMFSFIIPNTLLVNENTAKLRQFILDNNAIQAIRIFNQRVFRSAQVESVIIILQKNLDSQSHDADVVVVSDNGEHTINQRDFRTPPLFKFNIRQDSRSNVVLTKIQGCSVPMGQLTDICIGIQLGGSRGDDTKESFLTRSRLSSKYKPVLDGKEINRYSLQWSKRFVKYGDWLHRKRDVKYFLNPKMVIRQIGAAPVATFDGESFYTLNTIYNVISPGSPYNLKYILGLVNSRLLQWVWQVKVSDFKSLFPKIKKESLQTVPIRIINFSDTADKARHDKMVQLVESMLDLHKYKAAAKTQPDQELYQRQIEATDREIDALVYELYGLTPEEIAVVETAR